MKVCVVGLGYVGLPLAVELDKAGFEVVGYDIDQCKVDSADRLSIKASTSSETITGSDVVIVCVPTPVIHSTFRGWPEADTGPILSAAKDVGANMTPGSIVVLESTVSPGMTREIFIPELERLSGMVCGIDFFVGYSPEEINPGDDTKAVHSISKLIASDWEEALVAMERVYGALTEVKVVSSIEVAEAAKVVENIQRDVLLALNNELAFSLRLFGITGSDVFEAAAHKWNFVHLKPGLVGGHCIPVDPWYYMISAKQKGAEYFDILVSASARQVNDRMATKIAGLVGEHCGPNGCSVLIRGYAYKPDVPDIRETGSLRLARELERCGYNVSIQDDIVEPLIPPEYLVTSGDEYDVVIIAVDHSRYRDPEIVAALPKFLKPGGLLLDIPGTYKKTPIDMDVEYICL